VISYVVVRRGARRVLLNIYLRSYLRIRRANLLGYNKGRRILRLGESFVYIISRRVIRGIKAKKA